MKNAELKKVNKKQVFQLIYEKKTVAKSDVASMLNLSFPTVSQNINELEFLNLVEKKGYFQSAGGRKAVIISSISDAKIAIGVEVIKEGLELVAIDMYGKILKKEKHDLVFENSTLYLSRFGNTVNNFIIALNVSYKKILGISIAIQGVVSHDGSKVLYGHILNCDGMTRDDFAQYLSFPCILFHDSEAAANAELWDSKDITNAFYISIGRNIGGAAIINSQIHWGTTYPSGLVEHMTIDPSGDICYCGKKGCLETYCSVQSLLKGMDCSLEQFFADLRNHKEKNVKRWEDYRYHLAIAIDNLQMAINCEVIIGGHISDYMTDEDINVIKEFIEKNSSFNSVRQNIRLASCTSIAKGAALYYIKKFIDSIGEFTDFESENNSNAM